MMKLGMCGFTVGAAAYFRKFPVVEIQQTFYDPPPRATIEKWRRQAPETFEFTMKAWQVITHFGTSSTYRRLRREFGERERAEAGGFRVNDTTLAAWATTLEAMRALRATAVLFQCPASFRATDENVRAMRAFFAAIERPDDVGLLWEPRGPWPDELVLGLCRELGLLHAVDPFVRPSLTPELLYWRLHGNRSHWARYTDEELRQIIDWIPSNPDIETYVLFNNIPRVKDVKRFQELLADEPARG
ncbi:MAG TPA: DUF72 domain-containing protein [Gemmatimonadaceae bacterium]|nr:DUF72 domain-containing protein [Gemmatimonadaceae bacterium]